MKPFRIPFFALALGISLVFAFLLAGPVFAQDEVPPAPEETPVAETISTVEESAPAEEPLPAEEPPVVPVVEPAPAEEPAEVLVEELVPSVEEPVVEEGPEIVALDEGGAVLPLATQEAAEVMAEPDPWFACTSEPDGICSFVGADALRNAINNYAAMGGSGAIYIEAGTHTVTNYVIVDGTTVPNLTGIIADVASGSPKPILNLGLFNLQIRNTTKGFVLQGLNITGDINNALVNIYSNTGSLTLTDLEIRNINNAGMGFQVLGQTGNVTLNTVKADLNQDQGAYINATGNVVINNSSFDSNSQGGSGTGKNSLKVDAAGTITLNGVSASNFRRGNGAWLESDKGITVKNSLFNNNSDNNGVANDWGFGLYIPSTSKGPVVLDHVYANYNPEAYGVWVETTNGAVTLKTVEANNNRQGIHINNCLGGGGTCTTTAGVVSLTSVVVRSNYYGNLRVIANGAITANGVDSYYANNSGGFGGVILDNSDAKAVSAVSASNLSSTNNAIVGLKVDSRGAVTLNHVTTYNNNWGTASGILIQTDGAVAISSTLGENSSFSNTDYGTSISTKGAVSVSKLESTNNANTNLYIDNSGGASAVTITGGYYRDSYGGSGIWVTSKGAITVTDVDAQNNAVDGIHLENHTAGTAQPVTVKTSSPGVNLPISWNDGYGLFIQSKGNITLTNIFDYQNSGYTSPIYVDNTFGTGTVTITNMTVRNLDDIFGNNAAVMIRSHGVVTITGIEVQYSQDRGLVVDNCIESGGVCTTSGTPGVTISGLNVNHNASTPVDILSKGAVKITNTSANYNNTGEAVVKIKTGGSVTLDTTGTYTNSIYSSDTNGLWIDAGGAVTLKNFQISDNDPGYGLRISKATTVTITDIYVTGNPTYGINVESTGAITLTYARVFNNTGYNVWLNNSAGSAGVTINGNSLGGSEINTNANFNLRINTTGALKLSDLDISLSPVSVDLIQPVGDVTLTNVEIYNTGGDDALYIQSKGTVTATNVWTASAAGNGLWIDNQIATTPKSVTITNFHDDGAGNLSYALHVVSAGAISLTDFFVNGSDIRDYGIWLDNTASSAKAAVTVKKSAGNWANTAYRFDSQALTIYSDGLVSVDALYFPYNHLGVFIQSNQAGVTLTNSVIESGELGVDISAGGAITVTNVHADTNTGLAASLDNSSVVGAAVTAQKLWVYGNTSSSTGGGGLFVNSQGNVTITDLDAGSQTQGGYSLDVSTTGSVTVKSTDGNNPIDLSNNFDSGGRIVAGGNVTLTMVNAENSANGSGMQITSTAGAVSITNSRFNNNETFGLHVTVSSSSGAITLTNVQASDNATAEGAVLQNGSGGITIASTGGYNNAYTNNATINLNLFTSGPVNLTNVDAYGTAPVGIQFPNSGNPVGNVTMNTVNINGTAGLSIYSTGTVSISNLNASNTTSSALRIENWNVTPAKNVTLVNIYSNNGAGTYGVYVRSKGVISAKDLYLSNSVDGIRTYGAWLQNDDSLTAGVSLGVVNSTQNYIQYFADYGLLIYTHGAVTVDKLDVSENLNGITVDTGIGGASTSGVTLTNINATYNDLHGIYLRTNGNTVLTNVFSSNNGNSGGSGIDILVGETPTFSSGTVTLTNINLYGNNDNELLVNALKQVTIKNLDAYDYTFDGFGAYITTDGGVSFLDPGGTDWNNIYANDSGNIYIDAGGDVILQKMDIGGSDLGYGVQVIANGKVTITKMNAYSANLDGLNVDAGGAITASGLDMRNNYRSGAVLSNDRPDSTGGVTVTGSNLVSNYGAVANAGLIIETNGVVLLSQLVVTENYGLGTTVASKAAVTVNKSLFNDNRSHGLNVVTLGNITINGITAYHNTVSGSGVVLNNSTGGGTGTVSVLATLGANSFNNNAASGLVITSNRAVTVNNVTANLSVNGYGISIDTSAAPANLGTVTVTGAVLNRNGYHGIQIFADGIVSLTSIEAISNGPSGNYDGIHIEAIGYSALVQNSVASGNGRHGIYSNLGSGKTLTVKKTFYMGNNRWGPTDTDKNIETNGWPLTIVY